MRVLPLLVLTLIAVGILAACDEEKKEVISGKTDPETTPTMTTTDVSTLISDSGITRYSITTPLWLMYEEAAEPKWKFPDGLHLEKFDAKLKPEASIDCDSAIYHKDRQLWQLDGYVNIRNTLGEKFLTNQLFWNQRQQKIYSDSFIHIERDGKIIEGYGFESNEQMTRYHVLRVAGIFPADKFKQTVDLPQADTTSAPQPAPDIIYSGKPDGNSRPIKKRVVRNVNDAPPAGRLERLDVPSKELKPINKPEPARKPLSR